MLRKIKRVLIFLAVILLIICFFNIERVVPINEVSCSSQFGPCNSAINNSLVSMGSTNLHESIKNIDDYLSKHDRVSEYKYRYVFPNIIKVNINEVKPEVAVQYEGQQNFKLVDNKGKVLAEVAESQLPLIVTYQTLSEAEYEYAAQILLSLHDIYGIRTIRVERDYLQVFVPSGYEVLLPLNGDIDVLLGSLRLILFQLNDEAQEFRIKTIDLRYKNPVIR